MGKRGPQKTPTAVLEMRGSWRADTRPNEPSPSSGEPTKPAELSERASSVWGQVVPSLMSMGVLSVVDGMALARYCEIVVLWWDCVSHVRKYGLTHPVYKHDRTTGERMVVATRAFPQAKLVKEYAAELLRIERDFGLTPAARASISVRPAESQIDPLEMLLKGSRN